VNLIEFIGFIITIIAMFVILFRRAMDEKRRRENPELFQKEEENKEQALREFLQAMNIEVEETEVYEEPAPPPSPPEKKLARKKPARPKRLVRDAYELDSRIEDYEKTKGVESRTLETEVGDTEFRELGQDIVSGDLFLQPSLGAYEIDLEKKKSRASQLLAELKCPSDMVIYREILGKPRGLQRHILPHDLAE